MSQATSWNPDSYSQNARFVSDLGEPLLQLLDPKPRELILDLGCGDGALTEKMLSAGCAVYGVDASLAQIEAARRRGLKAVVMDGRQMGFRRCFAAVFSNAVLHWMKPPERVIEEVSKSLTPGGRFVGEFGGEGNVETIRAALHNGLRRHGVDPQEVDPWYYPSAKEYSGLLNKFGFTVDYIELIPRPTKLPGDILAWLKVFAQPFTSSISDVERETFLKEVKSELAPTLQNTDGSWLADYVRLRFKAVVRP